MDWERLRVARDRRSVERMWYWRGFGTGAVATAILAAILAIATGVLR